MIVTGTLALQSVEGTGLRFEARFASGLAVAYDSGAGAVAANPVEHLLGALAACQAMDVISILRKKRIDVTAYEVAFSGDRAETPPRRYVSVTLVHRVTGKNVPEAEVAEAVRLSETRYCSVYHTLDPALRVRCRVEVVGA